MERTPVSCRANCARPYDHRSTLGPRSNWPMSCDKLCLAAVLLLTNASLAAAAQGRSANAGATLLSESYTRLLDALTSGMSVEVTTNFTQCAAGGTGASGPT